MEEIDLAMKAGGKRSPRARWSDPLLSLLLCLVSPVLIVILAAGAVLSLGINAAWRMLLPKKKMVFAPIVCADNRPDWAEREFDVVLFGATGFTGRFAAEYIKKTHKDLKWAVAGRNAKALEGMSLGIPIILADASDSAALRALAFRTRAVISTAGPFWLHSSELLRQCASAGTHWADITGEADWVAETMAAHSAAARKSGVKMVSFCGHDSLPWDMLTFHLNSVLSSEGDSLAGVEFFDDIVAAPSGGTLATIFSILDGTVARRWAHRASPSAKSSCSFKIKNPSFLTWSSSLQQWAALFVMADVNAQTVKRSNELLNYNSSEMSYSEAQLFPSFCSALNATLLLIIGFLLMANYPLRVLLLSLGVLPVPGTGPSAHQLSKGYLLIKARARGTNGTVASGEYYLPNDPGYVDTARMLVECGVLLSKTPPVENQGGGFHTPASAFGGRVTESLQAGGTILKTAVLKKAVVATK